MFSSSGEAPPSPGVVGTRTAGVNVAISTEAPPIPTLLTSRPVNFQSKGNDELDLEQARPEVIAEKGEDISGEQPVTCLETLRNTWAVAHYFFKDPTSRTEAWALTLAVAIMVVLGTFLTLWLGELIKNTTNALVSGLEKKFYDCVMMLAMLISVALPLSVGEQWLCGALALEWRRYTTTWLLHRYISPAQTYYRMKVQNLEIDNPDQRIGQDVAELTASMVKLQVALLSATLHIVSMSAVLMALCADLFTIVLCLSAVGTLLFLRVFGGRLMAVTRHVLREEATFRFVVIRVREHAESIAFYQGAGFELDRCLAVFVQVLTYQYRKLAIFSIFMGSQKSMHAFASLLPMLVLGPRILQGELQIGVMMQANLLFGVLLNSFTTLISDLGVLASVGAQALRVKRLTETLDDLQKVEHAENLDDGIELCERDGAGDDVCLQLKGVVLQPPHGSSPLLSELSFVLRSGESLLIAGESGIGKSSLLRAIGGLWTAGRGSISRCKASHCFFVPQESYLCLGSLLENATYPRASDQGDSVSKAAVEDVLRGVNLGHLIERYGLDAAVSLESALSGGEKQRLGFARLLLQPGLELAVLDEATSALDTQNEDALYTMLMPRVRCLASVAHHINLEKFHTHKLLLQRPAAGGAPGAAFRRIEDASS